MGFLLNDKIKEYINNGISEELANKIVIADDWITCMHDQEFIAIVLTLYQNLVEASEGLYDSKIIKENAELYQAVTSAPVIALLCKVSESSIDIKTQILEFRKLKILLDNTKGISAKTKFIQRKMAEIGINTIDEIEPAYKVKDLYKITTISEAQKNEEGSVASEDELISIDETDFAEFDALADGDLLDIEDEDTFSLEDIMDSSENTEEKDEQSEKAKSEKEQAKSEKEIDEIIEKMKHSYNIEVGDTIDSLCATLNKLYLSGYEAMPLAGILINNPDNKPNVCRVASNSDIICVDDKGKMPDKRLLKALLNYQNLGSNLSNLCDDPDVKYSSIKDGGIKVFYKLHLALLSGSISFTANKHYSVRKFATRKSLDIGDKSQFSTVAISNKKTAEKWIRETVSYIIYRALYDAGIRPENAAERDAEIQQIAGIIDATLKNVIVVAERKKNTDTGRLVSTKIKIATTRVLDINDLVTFVSNSLNGSNSAGTIEVKTFGKNSSNVYNLEVIYNQEEANKADPFAAEMLDSIKGTGTNWSHVLMGKKDDGDYFFWDNFMNNPEPYRRCYTIYAGSRAGKGIMTSTLISSAIASGVDIFYTDGKPENGVTIGDIAWEDGLEAYVFDGRPEGAAPFKGDIAAYTNDVRKPNEVYVDTKNLPEELFAKDKKLLNDFCGIMRYLRSLCLCFTAIRYRSSKSKVGVDGKASWQLWVFDEVSNMAKIEASVRIGFGKYLNLKCPGAWDNSTLSPKSGISKYSDKNNKEYNATAEWIYNWTKWTNSIVSAASSASTIEMGKSDMNLLFIFQEASWLSSEAKLDKNDEAAMTFATTLAKVVKKLKSTKIIGKNAISYQCGEYGDGNTSKSDWYKAIQDGECVWGISKSSSVAGSSAKVELFKPYKVWTMPLKKVNGEDTLDKDPISKEESKKYLNGYVTELIGHKPSKEINKAYLYGEFIVKELGLGENLKDYIYNCHTFTDEQSGNAIAESQEKYEKGQDGISSEENGNNGIGTVIDIDNSSDAEEMWGEESKTNTAASSYEEFVNNILNKAEGENQVREEQAREEQDITDEDKEIVNNRSNNEYQRQEEEPTKQTEYKTDLSKAQQVLSSLDSDKIRNMFSMLGYANADELTEAFDVISKYKEESPVEMTSTARVFNTNNEDELIVNQNISTIPLLPMDNRNSIPIIGMISKKMYETARKNFETKNGTSYELHNRLMLIIDSALKYYNNDVFRIKKLRIDSSQIIINGRIIPTGRLVGDDVDIYDIIDFETIFNSFNQLQAIQLDKRAFEVFSIDHYTTESIIGLFDRLQNLRVLAIDGLKEPFTRTALRSKIESYKEEASKAKLKNEIDAVAAAKNPRLSRKNPAYKLRKYEQLQKLRDANLKGYIAELESKDTKWYKRAGRRGRDMWLGLRMKATGAHKLTEDFKR